MFPHKQQPSFKFVIRSKLPEAAPPPSQHNDTPPSAATTTSTAPASEPTTAAPLAASDSGDNERKRKRSDKESVPLASKKVHSQLQKWNQKKAELKEQAEVAVAAAAAAAASGSPEDAEPGISNISSTGTGTSTGTSTSSDPAVHQYADISIMACLLCQRKFKTRQDLQRHQDMSELHKKNLADPVAVGKAEIKMRYVKTEEEQAQEQLAQQNYRNRAAERRQAYNQPERPVLPVSSAPPREPRRRPAAMTLSELRAKQEMAKETASAGTSLDRPLNDDNVGARMLQQMGWKRGEGLGKDASGIVDPIAAEQYAQGVGLGAAHAKRPASAAASGDTYKDRVKETARRRFDEEL